MSRKVIALMVTSLLWAQVAVAEIDAMALALLQPYQSKQALRWDNIEGAPLWLKGIAPEYDSQWQMHVIRLEAGQQSSFYLPAHESLRLYHPERSLQPSDIAVYLSSGTGLLAEIEMQASVDGHSLILSPQSAYSQVVHVSHSGGKMGAAELAVLISRRDQLKEIAPYRNLKGLTGKPVGLSKWPLQIPEMYWQMQAHQKEVVDIEGPARIVLKNRLRYETQAAELIQDYRIRYRLNDGSPVWLDFASGAESNRTIFVNMLKEIVGREQQAFIEIPPGRHRLEMMSDRNLYLKVLEQREDDYLLPLLNQPPLSLQTIRKQGLVAEQKLPEINALAQQTVRDNSRKSSALSGQQLLKQAVLKRPDYPAGMAEAEKLLGQRTFYRDLLPSIKHSREDQFNAYFVSKKIRAIRRAQHDAVVADQHRAAALNGLGNAYFSPISTIPDSYSLSERYAPTRLRIIADKRQCRKRRFSIQMDHQPPRKFVLYCQDDVSSDDAFVRSLSETALLDLHQLTGISGNMTLGHLFAAHRKPVEMIPAAIHEIALPQKVRQLKVWCDDNDKRPLNLALQIRAAKPYQFSEQSYLARLDDLSKERLFKLFIDGLTGEGNTDNRAEQELQNEWISLRRFLTGLYRHYRSAVAEKIPAKILAEQSQLKNWRKLAQRAEQRQQWTEALEIWARVIETSKSADRDQAQLAQAAILERLSENYMATSLWRYLSLYAQPTVANRAKTQLLAKYKRENDSAAIQMLAAAMFVQRPDQKSLNFLIEASMENEHYRFALLLGLLAADPPLELMLNAAYKLNWWQSYQQWLAQLPPSQQWFWKGLKAQKQGDYQTALEAWRKSGSEDWVQQLQRGLVIGKQLLDSQDVALLYHNWSHWQRRHPGSSVWQDAARLVKDAAGTDQYYAVERDLYSKAFRGTIQRPVKLRVLGPVNLKFKIRVLHGRADAQLATWLRISDNRKDYRFPINNNRPVQGLALTGEGDYSPSNLVSVEYQVGQGIHEIELSSNGAPVSVAVSEQRPELPLTVLAPLQLDTFTHALYAVTSVNENQFINQIPVKPSTSMAIAERDVSLPDLQQLPTVENARQAEARMMQYLAALEKQKEGRAELLFAAEQLQQRFPEEETVQAIWRRMSRYSQLQAVNSIVSSAGIRFVDILGWQPASLSLATRKALISKTKPDEHVVFSDQRLRLMMTNLAARTLHVEALLDDVVFLSPSPAQLQYQIDEREPRSFTIAQSEGWKKFSLRIPAGQHQIRFWIAKPVANQFLKLRFQDNVTDLKVSQEKSFFISTWMEPFRFYVNGPAMIRIDEWLVGKMTSRYQDVAAGWQLVTIPPGSKQQESLLQVKQRVAIDTPKPVMSRVVRRKLQTVVAPAIPVQEIQASKLVKIEDDFQLGRQEDGTWSLGMDLVRRNNVQEDSDQGDAEQFLQFRSNHRYFDDYRNAYWNTLGFIRAREHGNPSFGVIESVYIKPDNFPLVINLQAKLISQIVHEDLEWLGQFKIALSQSAHLTPKTTVIPKFSWFGRYLSLRDSGRVFKDGGFRDEDLNDRVDQDIYTVYKTQHNSGLSASLLFSHDPWLDTRWTAKIKSVSNENMNFFNPDYFSSEAHWKQLLGDVNLDASYRISFYQKDQDRAGSSKRHFTKLELNWQSWTPKLDRLEITGQYNYDIDKKEHLGMLSFSYHFGEGRGYRDFKPGEIDFRQIRERQRLDEYN